MDIFNEPLGIATLILGGAALAIPAFGWAPFIVACVLVVGGACLLSL